jgi:hypothetical protein
MIRPTYRKLASWLAPHPPGAVVQKNWRPHEVDISVSGATSDTRLFWNKPFTLDLNSEDIRNPRHLPGNVVGLSFQFDNTTEPLIATAVQPVESGTTAPVLPPSPPRLFQISERDQEKWVPIPAPGQPGFPLKIFQNRTYSVRVVASTAANPKDYSLIWTGWQTWTWGYLGNLTVDGHRNQIDLDPTRLSTSPSDLLLVSSAGSSNITTGLQVVEDVAFKQRIMAQLAKNPPHVRLIEGGNSLVLKKFLLPQSEALLEPYGLPPNTPVAAVRVTALHTDGTPAGDINRPGPADDLIPYSMRESSRPVRLAADDRPGAVRVQMDLFDSHGILLGRTVPLTLYFDSIRVTATPGPWKPGQSANSFERDIFLNSTWARNGAPFSGSASMQVRLNLTHPTPESAAAIHLSSNPASIDPSKGKDGSRVTEYWDWTPAASRQLSAYKVVAEVEKYDVSDGR